MNYFTLTAGLSIVLILAHCTAAQEHEPEGPRDARHMAFIPGDAFFAVSMKGEWNDPGGNDDSIESFEEHLQKEQKNATWDVFYKYPPVEGIPSVDHDFLGFQYLTIKGVSEKRRYLIEAAISLAGAERRRPGRLRDAG